MSSTIFRQHDKRWGSLPYPTKNSSFAGNGCGCCSVTHLAIENPKYAKLTPKDVRKFMVKYAVSGKGTMWDGIPKGLKNYGYKDVVHISASDPMSKAFKYIKKGYTMGVILFSAGWGGTTSKVYWTGGGHYIAFNKVKNVTGTDAYFYMKDSGGRKHDGWYSYQRSMKNRVYQMWLVKPIKVEKPKTKPKTERDKMVDDMMAFAKKYADNQKYHYKKWKSNDSNTKLCPICAKQTKAEYLGWNCIGFATAICYHGGGMKHIRCSCSGLGNDGWFTQLLKYAKQSPNTALKYWKKRNGNNWEIVWNKGKKIPSSMLKAGDVCTAFSGDTYKHTFVYAGNGYIYDSTSGKTQISKRKYSSLGITNKIAFRPTGRKG